MYNNTSDYDDFESIRERRKKLTRMKNKRRDNTSNDEIIGSTTKTKSAHIDHEREKRIKESVKNMEERCKNRINRKRSGKLSGRFISLIEKEDGTVEYSKWIVIFLLTTMFFVLLIYFSGSGESYCTCDS